MALFPGVVNLSTDSNLPPKFFHGFVMVPPRGITADVYHMFLARHCDIHNNLYRVIIDFTVMVLAMGNNLLFTLQWVVACNY